MPGSQPWLCSAQACPVHGLSAHPADRPGAETRAPPGGAPAMLRAGPRLCSGRGPTLRNVFPALRAPSGEGRGQPAKGRACAGIWNQHRRLKKSGVPRVHVQEAQARPCTLGNCKVGCSTSSVLQAVRPTPHGNCNGQREGPFAGKAPEALTLVGRCPQILSVQLFSSVNVGCPLGRGHAFPFRLGLWKIGSPSELSQGPLTDLGVLLTGITQPTHMPPPQTPIRLSCTRAAWHGDAGPSTQVPLYLGSVLTDRKPLPLPTVISQTVCSRRQGQSWPPRPLRPAPADGETGPGRH